MTTYNSALPSINKVMQYNLSIICTNEDMKKIFQPSLPKALYRIEKNLKEILSLPYFHQIVPNG